MVDQHFGDDSDGEMDEEKQRERETKDSDRRTTGNEYDSPAEDSDNENAGPLEMTEERAQ